MIHTVFSIYDKKAAAYGKLWTAINASVATRSFAEACNDGKSDFFKYHGDYDLMEFGTWDDNSGVFSFHRKPKYVVAASSLVVNPVAPVGEHT